MLQHFIPDSLNASRWNGTCVIIITNVIGLVEQYGKMWGLCIVLYCIVSYVFYITLQQADVRVWIEGGTGIVLYCIVLRCVALHCIALYCMLTTAGTVMYEYGLRVCILLYCMLTTAGTVMYEYGLRVCILLYCMLTTAGTVMYEYGLIVGQELSNLKGLQQQAKCYLAMLNALRLVDPKYAWIVKPIPSTVQVQLCVLMPANHSDCKWYYLFTSTNNYVYMCVSVTISKAIELMFLT